MGKKIDRFSLDAQLGIDNGRPAPGLICAANAEERFVATHFSEPLTTYAVGWRDPENLEALIDAMFPAVEVARRFEFKSAVNAEQFFTEVDDIRAIGSDFKRVEYRGTSVNAATLNKGLMIRLDNDEMGLPGAEERAVARLLQRLWRNELRRGVSGLVTASAGGNTGKTWDGTTPKDPDMDVLAKVISYGDTVGIDANVVAFGLTAWQKRVQTLRAQNTPGGYSSASMTPDQLAEFLGVDRVVKCKARYSSSMTAKTQILGGYVLIYMAPQGVGLDDPSNVKRFWTPTDSGKVRVYREVHAKYIDISVEHYSNIILTSSLGPQMLTIS